MNRKNTKISIQNQVNNNEKLERKKKAWEERNWKIYFKHDGCSMLLFKNLNGTNAIIRAKALNRLYSDWCGKFIVTK